MTEADESRGTARSNGASPVVNLAALEPLYQTFEEPCRYRAPGEGKGDPAQIISGRRPSYIPIAQNLRRFVKDWRDSDYPGASQTTRDLLHFWFGEEHLEVNCNMCDNCLADVAEKTDVSEQAKMFLSAIYRAKEAYPVARIIKILRGSKAREVTAAKDDQLSVYGIGKG